MKLETLSDINEAIKKESQLAKKMQQYIDKGINASNLSEMIIDVYKSIYLLETVKKYRDSDNNIIYPTELNGLRPSPYFLLFDENELLD